MLSDGLYSLLIGAAPVAAILGQRTTPAGRPRSTGVFLGQMPEASPVPAIVISQVAGETLFSMDGPSAMRFVRFQFTCYATTAIVAKQLQRVVRQTLEAFTGALSDGTQVGDMECVLEIDSFQEAPFLFTSVLDMKITFLDLGS